MGAIGTGTISATYIDTIAKRFDIIKVDAIADRHIEKAQKAAEKYGARACSLGGLLADAKGPYLQALKTPVDSNEAEESNLIQGGRGYDRHRECPHRVQLQGPGPDAEVL